MTKIELTSCQKDAMKILEGKDNVFITGEAGTGKSYLLNQFMKGKPTKRFPVVASTGAAAILVGGRTFHSFFGLGIMQGGKESTVQRALRNGKLVARLNAAECIIIDEVSMLSGSALEAAEQIAQEGRYSDEPWGGLRIIAVGDFAQLPPISENRSEKEWAFQHHVWQTSNFTTVDLKTVVRSKDEEYIRLLQCIRRGEVHGAVENYLNSKILEDTEHFEGTRLYSHRTSVEKFNLSKLHELKGKLWEFHTVYKGTKAQKEILKKKSPIPETLLLKTGALVMIRKNDNSESEAQMIYVNGSLGHIRKITEKALEIDLFSGRRIKLTKHSFDQINGDGETTAQACNFPVNLAWASTIHKAQGATLDKVLVSLKNLWEPGQAYVALSRTRSGDNLFIENWSPRSIITEPVVEEFYEGLS